MKTTARPTEVLGRLVLRGERLFLNGAGDAVLLLGIAAGSAIALVSLLAPAV